MVDVLRRSKRWINYFIKRKDEYDLHSPFVFELYNYLKSADDNVEFNLINRIRKYQLKSNEIIRGNDLGAGSKINNNSKNLKLSNVTLNAAISEKYGRLLFKLIKNFQPSNIIELGTSTGISTLYLALASPAHVYTIEGNPGLVNIAKNNFQKANCNNISVFTGEFSEQLPNIINKIDKVDFAFIDGNHRLEPTLNYFNLIKENSHEMTILVFDDIHWSEEMEQAWQEIIKDKGVTKSIDFFRLGIVFFRKEISKQHFVLKF